jgi:hypothetical protein
MRAKITAYNNNSGTVSGCSDFGLSCYWGNDYKNVFYVCGDLGRSTFEDIIETETDITGQTERIQNTSIERFNISVLAITPLLQFLKTLDKHDVKTIEFLDTGDVYNIKNIDIEDQGETLTPTNLVYITFEDEPISQITPNFYEVDDQKTAFWDNNGDGTPDINGDQEYNPTLEKFTTNQLYYEADGITPATSGDVKIFVYAITADNNDNLIGFFAGQFGDLLTDSTKWQSTQSIWNFFEVGAATIGHNLTISFYKKLFATANGYLSDETENRAVKLRFDISINGSTSQSSTQNLVYTIAGAFHRAEVQDLTTGKYGVTTIGRPTPEEKNTLNTLQDINILGLVTNLITSFVLDTVTPFSNVYTIDLTDNSERGFNGAITTIGGYEGENFRASISRKNFCLGPDDLANISHQSNVLNFTAGASPYNIGITWLYQRQNAVYPVYGDITAAGDAEVLLNGVLVNNLPTITPALLQVLGTQNITLPDTDINKIRFTLPTTTGFDIYTEFDAQIKPLF